MTIAALAVGLVTLVTGTDLGEARFLELHAEIAPDEEETWRTIPWRTDLGAARVEAARLGRPLFLWAMNGHPLGCT